MEHAHPLLEGAVSLSALKVWKPVRAVRYNMFGFFQQRIDVYLELAKAPVESLKKVTTPSIDDHMIKPEDLEKADSLAQNLAQGWSDSSSCGRSAVWYDKCLSGTRPAASASAD